VLAAGLFSACSKDDPDTLIQQYISDNNLTVEQTNEGLYYVIDVEGTGDQPVETDEVRVVYKGTLLNGDVFDSNQGIPENEVVGFNLQNAIRGWAIGITQFREGGEGLLIIPPELAYGENPPLGSIIGKNEPLIFEVKILEIVPEPEVQIQNFLTENNLTAEKTPEGLYYIIENEGTGDRPTERDDVSVHYEGRLLTGQVFDSNLLTPSGSVNPFNLSQVIDGWRIGIPLFKEEGKGMLIIPPHLGYGNRPPVGTIIQPNSVLVFDVELLDVL